MNSRVAGLLSCAHDGCAVTTELHKIVPRSPGALAFLGSTRARTRSPLFLSGTRPIGLWTATKSLVVVPDTGPSAFLPNGEGMFRFTTPEQAVRAFEAINGDYERHCRAARKLAETYFDSKQIARKILNCALHDKAPRAGRFDSLTAGKGLISS